ncbi:filamentous hemagglutinin N-terminal domain-containing protein [Methylobacter sp.]|uniref:two-partner secretion domain-containing protein n=1 Tax=Methylobacter sp. TaxID=2051955 RepID=UPI0025FB1F12|nr:filamentous hemagglutinin N-terminal domain-containing protein [Methylobacter sp.]
MAVCCRETTLHLAILAVLYPALSYANPDGAQVISGQVSIDTATPGLTTVTNSPNAIINWQNFSIGQNELTQFIQQNGQSAVLNRIIGQNPSEILGQLASNGKVFLINPNGIVFGAGSVIDTQGLIASSLNLSDQDFLNGNYHFMAGSGAGNIRNEGIIRAGKDGNIILIAPQIENNGIIKSDGGSITLAAGQELTITNLDNPDIRFQVQAPADSVLNLGKLLSEGGAINVFASTIKHSGEINADSVQVDKQGHIQLVAQQDITLAPGSRISANNSRGNAGSIHIDSKTGTTLAYGTIEAQATQVGKGGNIELLGERVGVLDQAHIDASGENGGGEILIGGDYQGKNSAVHNAKATYIGKDAIIKADAKTTGNGGKVIVWSDESTRAYGDISARGGSLSGNGGFIETSGHWLDINGIKINASSANGQGGEWLLDPFNLVVNGCTGGCIVNTGGLFESNGGPTDVSATDIVNLLNTGTSVTLQTGAGGNIDVNVPIIKTNVNTASLTLTAQNNITIAAAISINSGNLDLNAAGTIESRENLTAANISFKASDMNLLSGYTINGSNSVSLLSSNITWLGSTGLNSGKLELSSTELNTITTPVLRIGDINSGAIDIKSALALANPTTLNLTSGGAITQQAGATIATSSLSASGASVTLTEANPVGVISGKATAGDFRYRSSNQLTISTVDGVSGITAPTANNIALESGVGINQQSGANLSAGGLALKTVGAVNLFNTNNKINKIAADLKVGGLGSGSFDFFSSSNLSVDSVLSVDGSTLLNGITTNNQDIDISSSTLSINQPINAGTGSVDIATDTLTWDASSNGKVIASDSGIQTYTPGRPITVGAACIGGAGTCLSVTELWRISAAAIGIGAGDFNAIKHNAGDIFVAGITSGSSILTDRNALTTRIGLVTGAGVTQSATAIDVQDLGIKANGTVLLSAANNITNLAAITLGQDFTFNNAKGLNVIQMIGGTAPDNYNVNGILTNNGNVSLTTLTGGVNVLAPINAGSGSITIAANNSGILDINAPLTAGLGRISLTGGSLIGSQNGLLMPYFNAASGTVVPAVIVSAGLTETYTDSLENINSVILGTTQPQTSNTNLIEDSGNDSTDSTESKNKNSKQCTK